MTSAEAVEAAGDAAEAVAKTAEATKAVAAAVLILRAVYSFFLVVVLPFCLLDAKSRSGNETVSEHRNSGLPMLIIRS